MKQFIVGVLLTTILAAGLFSLYQSTRADAAAPAEPGAGEVAAPQTVAVDPDAVAEPVPAPEVAGALPEPLVIPEPVAGPATTAPLAAAPAAGALGQQGGRFGQQTNSTPGAPQVQAQTHMTTTLTESGTVQAVELTGLSLLTADGEPLWVQLGQSRFWQSQGVAFNVGDAVTVTGFFENGQFQAASVANDTTGQLLTLRDTTGRPLWAGGGRRGGSGQGGYRGGQG